MHMIDYTIILYPMHIMTLIIITTSLVPQNTHQTGYVFFSHASDLAGGTIYYQYCVRAWCNHKLYLVYMHMHMGYYVKNK